MPKRIDHDERRNLIAQAVWRVALRDGVGAVSVREVAAEADISAGSLRHLVATKAELLEIASELIYHNVEERLLQPRDESDPVAWATSALSELLPVDSTRATEWEAGLALQAEAPSVPGLKEYAAQAQLDVRFVCATILQRFGERGVLAKGVAVDRETTRLHALLDGLALHMAPGGTVSVAEGLEVLHSHLSDLVR